MYRLEYIWQLPVRATHWIVAAAIFTLSFTGIFIYWPWLFRHGFITRYMIATHVVVACALLCAVVWRIAWAFMGNRWSSWRVFIPFATARGRREMLEMLRFYLFVRRSTPFVAGHNPLAATAYLAVYALLIVEIYTGFALFTFGWGGWTSTFFSPLFHLFAVNGVRLTHYLIMWFLLAFAVHHVYSAALMDTLEHSGILSSIITGFKFVRRGP